MKAAVYERYGPPEVVQIKDIERPVPKAGEVLIKVHATSVNRTDCGFRSASYAIIRLFHGFFKPRIKVLGCEFAGEIAETGSSVTRWKSGDRVFGFNDARWGGHAEFMVLHEEDAIARIPENISWNEAAVATEGAHYALNNIRAAKLTAGQSVMINGATGAIGSAAVQLCREMGAEIYATANTENIELVKSLGASVVIDWRKEDFTLIDKRFDFVFDAVGKSTFGRCKKILKPNGVYISTELGPGVQNPFLAISTSFSSGKKLLFPIPKMNEEVLGYLQELLSKGKLRPVIDRVYNLDEVMEAYHYVETGMKTGNVVVEVA